MRSSASSPCKKFLFSEKSVLQSVYCKQSNFLIYCMQSVFHVSFYIPISYIEILCFRAIFCAESSAAFLLVFTLEISERYKLK